MRQQPAVSAGVVEHPGQHQRFELVPGKGHAAHGRPETGRRLRRPGRSLFAAAESPRHGLHEANNGPTRMRRINIVIDWSAGWRDVTVDLTGAGVVPFLASFVPGAARVDSVLRPLLGPYDV